MPKIMFREPGHILSRVMASSSAVTANPATASKAVTANPAMGSNTEGPGSKALVIKAPPVTVGTRDTKGTGTTNPDSTTVMGRPVLHRRILTLNKDMATLISSPVLVPPRLAGPALVRQ